MALILFLSGVNLAASAFDITLPGYVLPNSKGGLSVLVIVTSCSGIAMIVGLQGATRANYLAPLSSFFIV